MKPILSILIPSRDRPGGLLGAIGKFLLTSPGDAAFEILVRLDSDDLMMASVREDIDSMPKTRVITGPPIHEISPHTRGDGAEQYACYFYEELSNSANGHWIWIFNDDAWIRGDTWYQQLNEFPLDDSLIMTESQQNRQSRYQFQESTVFPIFPKAAWTKIGMDRAPSRIDEKMVGELKAANWPVRIIKDCWTVHHWLQKH
jgi:hypothetical protein